MGELYAHGYDQERSGVGVATAKVFHFFPITHADLKLLGLVGLLSNVGIALAHSVDHIF